MADFPQAVESVQALFREHAEEGEEEMGWLLSSERSREAEQVAPCAARLVQGEMDATGRLAVARGPSVGPLGSPPSLAEKLGSKLAKREPGDGLRPERASGAWLGKRRQGVKSGKRFCQNAPRGGSQRQARERPPSPRLSAIDAAASGITRVPPEGESTWRWLPQGCPEAVL